MFRPATMMRSFRRPSTYRRFSPSTRHKSPVRRNLESAQMGGGDLSRKRRQDFVTGLSDKNNSLQREGGNDYAPM